MLRTLADPTAIPIRRRLTSALRLLPSFLVIGAQRGGSSFLYSLLAQHPQVAPALVKEVHFFDLNFQRGLPWYRAHFPAVGSARGRITGEATPYYLFHPLAPERIAKALPRARLIVVLRNPVDRAYSHYQKEHRKGTEILPFERAIQAESERVPGEREKLVADPTYRSVAHQRYSYLARGVYVEQLDTWRRHFDPAQMLILRSEDVFRDPSSAVGQACEFLSLPRWEPTIQRGERKVKYAPMSSAMRAQLVEYFRPHNARLQERLNRDFAWDR